MSTQATRWGPYAPASCIPARNRDRSRSRRGAPCQGAPAPALQHQSRDRLPVGGRSGGSGPECRNILGEAADGHLLVGRPGLGLICQKVIIVGRETKLRLQRLLPALLQRAGDQPVLRLDSIILPACTLDLV